MRNEKVRIVKKMVMSIFSKLISYLMFIRLYNNLLMCCYFVPKTIFYLLFFYRKRRTKMTTTIVLVLSKLTASAI